MTAHSAHATHTVWLAQRRPCWHCTAYLGLMAGGAAARCARPDSARVRAMPEAGCSAFEREVGADDEPDRLPPTEVLAPACTALPSGRAPTVGGLWQASG